MKLGDFIWALVFIAITTFLVVPDLRDVFVQTTNAHPYLMGFAKFGIMAFMGELLTLRILNGKWLRPAGMLAKIAIWGLLGVAIVLMFQLFSEGTVAAISKGLLPGAPGITGKVLQALFISALMNLTFGAVFMGVHRITDTWIDMRAEKKETGQGKVIDSIDWAGFIHFVVCKTIPVFWIPAHTITFLLPPQYRVIMAAYLSVALGLILAYARRRNK